MSQLQSPSDLLCRTEQVIGADLADVERIYASELATDNPFIADIYQHTSRFRGKRLRPILCLLAAHATGGIRREHHVLAAVIEMIHTATLVHDDVLDSADVRRRVATVNVRWNNQTSVLYGDFLFTHAFHLAASTGSADACRIIGRATNRVCEGELTQIRNRGNCNLTESEYLDIIDGKTAELCAVACLIGARFCDVAPARISHLETYGRKLGLAFQIADDVLDLTGIETAVGKTLGTDLRQQKLTLPVIRLLTNSSEETRQELVTLLEERSPNSQQEIVARARQHGTIDEAYTFARDLADEARRELHALPDSDAKDILLQLPSLAIDRIC